MFWRPSLKSNFSRFVGINLQEAGEKCLSHGMSWKGSIVDEAKRF
jgi:hypothetical protein